MAQLNPSKVISDLMNHYCALTKRIKFFQKKYAEITHDKESVEIVIKEVQEEMATTKAVLIKEMLTKRKDMYRNRQYAEDVLAAFCGEPQIESGVRAGGAAYVGHKQESRAVKGRKD
jgi:hypothetical protein